MDIAKIRKKALLKDAEEKPSEKPVPGTAAEQEPEAASEDAADREPDIPRGERLSEETPQAAAGESEDLSGGEITAESPDETVELLTFSLSHEEYAFRVPYVEEILRFQKISRVPTMPEYVLGITSLRGKIIPVIDLKRRLNLQEKSPGTERSPEEIKTDRKRATEKKILIIEGPKGLIGAAIDTVRGVVRLPRGQVLQPPGNLDENELKFIEGIVVLNKRFISIIHSETAMDVLAG